jgi:RNA-directed DNA polymerase
MNQSNDIRLTQKSFARKAQAEPEHRFQDLWHILCREDWIKTALARTLTNSGSRTAGVDGISKKDLNTDAKQVAFTASLQSELKSGTYEPMPVRRTWIPKPGKSEKRPLGIPTIKDRVVQEMLRMLMEPIWENDFLDCSHGFRPGRRTMDCIETLYSRIQPCNKYYWVIEGDIRKCFDRIHHKKLIELVRKRIADKRVVQLIDAFLKAGVMEDGFFQETPEGTPQGGILSPLLANIYLHELDRWWWEKYGGLSQEERSKRRQRNEGNFILTRYADDFIILCNGTKESAEQIKQEMKDFLLNELHLELSDEKTHITHATEGFDFLGFHVQREEPKDNKPWLRVTPTRKSEQHLRDTIQAMTDRALVWEPVPAKINAINRVLRGWGNYYKNVSSSLIRSKLDWYVSQRILKWLGERHKGMGKRAILKKYYIRQGKRKNWGCRDGQETVFLFMLRDIQHSNYPRKKRNNPYLDDNANPDFETETPHMDTWDGTTSRRKAEWWEARNQALIRDNHRCTQCGSTEELEVHHLKPSGGNRLDNLQTLCQKCHVQTPSYGIDRRQNKTGCNSQWKAG